MQLFSSVHLDPSPIPVLHLQYPHKNHRFSANYNAIHTYHVNVINLFISTKSWHDSNPTRFQVNPIGFSDAVKTAIRTMSDNLDNAITRAMEQVDSIRANLQRLDSLPFDQRRTLDGEIDRQLMELDSAINSMTASLKNVLPSDKDYYTSEIQGVRTSHGRLSAELRQKRTAMMNSPEYRQGQQIQSNFNKSTSVVNDLEDAIVEGNNAIMVGNRTLATLQDDRRTIENIDQNLMYTHMAGREGQSRAKAMLRRICFNKVIIWLIVIVLVALLGLSIYLKFFVIGKSKSSGGESGGGDEPAKSLLF